MANQVTILGAVKCKVSGTSKRYHSILVIGRPSQFGEIVWQCLCSETFTENNL